MVNQEVISYIQAEIVKGTSLEQIKNNLLANKWSQGNINEAFAQLNLQQATNQPLPPQIFSNTAQPTVGTVNPASNSEHNSEISNSRVNTKPPVPIQIVSGLLLTFGLLGFVGSISWAYILNLQMSNLMFTLLPFLAYLLLSSLSSIVLSRFFVRLNYTSWIAVVGLAFIGIINTVVNAVVFVQLPNIATVVVEAVWIGIYFYLRKYFVNRSVSVLGKVVLSVLFLLVLFIPILLSIYMKSESAHIVNTIKGNIQSTIKTPCVYQRVPVMQIGYLDANGVCKPAPQSSDFNFPSPSPLPTPTPIVATSWQTYSNKDFNFQLEVPAGWNVKVYPPANGLKTSSDLQYNCDSSYIVIDKKQLPNLIPTNQSPCGTQYEIAGYTFYIEVAPISQLDNAYEQSTNPSNGFKQIQIGGVTAYASYQRVDFENKGYYYEFWLNDSENPFSGGKLSSVDQQMISTFKFLK